ncbi:SET domain-containing protein, partial [Mycena pura]
PYGRGAQLSLALALSGELASGAASPWSPYLQSLPREIQGIPLFWNGGARNGSQHTQNGSPIEWLNGTEAAKILFDSGDSQTSLVSEIDEYYEQFAQPVFSRAFASSPEKIPSLHEFYHAFALVSSRSFLVDAYQGLCMVPIADAFNHAQENHVHLESDFDVCPECGSLQRCLHDDTLQQPVPRSVNPDNAYDSDNFYEMVSNVAIPPNVEIFNTYGETLSNAQLLVQYGFILDVNENDCLTWTSTELAQFSENYLSASGTSWRWNTIGGLSQFNALLGSLTSLPWDSISHSEMVHLDRVQPFSLNGDASVSHGLWLYFALLLCLMTTPLDHHSTNAVVSFLEDLFQRQLAFEQLLTGEQTPPPVLDDDNIGAAPFSVILELAGLLALLCRTRAARTGKAGVQTAELGDMLDRLPNDMTPTRMVLSLALTERSLLDSCVSAWEACASLA